MTREAFKQVVEQAIEQLTIAAEQATGRELPRKYCFSWLAQEAVVADGDIAEFLTSAGYVDEAHIWPCWDLFLVCVRPDGRLQLMGYRAGFAPCPYGNHPAYNGPGHGAGQVGPFKLGLGSIHGPL
jgi:hypothetical protein